MRLRLPPNRISRRALARARAVLARQALADCQLCAHHCGVNRLAGERGLCRAGAAARVFSAQVEVGDEMELIPSFAIALSGCDLRCAFCITGAESWNPQAGEPLNPTALAARAEEALAAGARSIMILGGEPTVHLPAALEIVAALPEDATLVWKTNAHGTAEARAFLEGLFDVWVADYKFGNDACAQRLARSPDYTETVRENVRWARAHADLIVRHLLMPGHVECCWRPVAQWLAECLSGVKVSLRASFWPAWQSARHAELRGTVQTQEWEWARAIGRDHGLALLD
jgi:putative pyruvate formate lyase activating enzyme